MSLQTVVRSHARTPVRAVSGAVVVRKVNVERRGATGGGEHADVPRSKLEHAVPLRDHELLRLVVAAHVVVRQVVDGVQPYIDVNAMDTLEAQDLIVSKGWTYRVTVIDGVRVVDDDSRVPSRYNLWVTTDGKVVFHEIDTVRLDEIWEPSVAN